MLLTAEVAFSLKLALRPVWDAPHPAKPAPTPPTPAPPAFLAFFSTPSVSPPVPLRCSNKQAAVKAVLPYVPIAFLPQTVHPALAPTFSIMIIALLAVPPLQPSSTTAPARHAQLKTATSAPKVMSVSLVTLVISSSTPPVLQHVPQGTKQTELTVLALSAKPLQTKVVPSLCHSPLLELC